MERSEPVRYGPAQSYGGPNLTVESNIWQRTQSAKNARPIKQGGSGVTRTADPAAVGETVREIREEQGLTIQELAQKADVSRNTISEIENGKRTCTGATLAKIARAMNTTGARILARSEGQEEEPGFYRDLKQHMRDTVEKLQIPGSIRAITMMSEQLLTLETGFHGEKPPTWDPDVVPETIED